MRSARRLGAPQLKAACGAPLRGTTDSDALCGAVSANIEASLASSSKLDQYAALFGLLTPPGPVAELWDLAGVVASRGGRASNFVPAIANPQVPHQSSVPMLLNHKAQELEMRKNVKVRDALPGAVSVPGTRMCEMLCSSSHTVVYLWRAGITCGSIQYRAYGTAIPAPMHNFTMRRFDISTQTNTPRLSPGCLAGARHRRCEARGCAARGGRGAPHRRKL